MAGNGRGAASRAFLLLLDCAEAVAASVRLREAEVEVLLERSLPARLSRGLREDDDAPTSAFACSRAEEDALAGMLGGSSAFVTNSPRRALLLSGPAELAVEVRGAAFSCV